MVLIPVLCPHCQSDNVVKRDKTDTGKQRYLCKNDFCPHSSFQLEYSYNGRLSEIKQKIIEMALNGSGIRDTARVLSISPTTVIDELKKRILARARADQLHPIEDLACEGSSRQAPPSGGGGMG